MSSTMRSAVQGLSAALIVILLVVIIAHFTKPAGGGSTALAALTPVSGTATLTTVPMPTPTATPLPSLVTAVWPAAAFSHSQPIVGGSYFQLDDITNDGRLIGALASANDPHQPMSIGYIDPASQKFKVLAQGPADNSVVAHTDGRYIAWMSPSGFTGGPGGNFTTSGFIDMATGKATTLIASSKLVAAPNGHFAVDHGFLAWVGLPATLAQQTVTINLTNLGTGTTIAVAKNVASPGTDAQVELAYPYLLYDTTESTLDRIGGVRILHNVQTGKDIDINAFLTRAGLDQQAFWSFQIVNNRLYLSDLTTLRSIALIDLPDGQPTVILNHSSMGFDVSGKLIVWYDQPNVFVWDGTQALRFPVLVIGASFGPFAVHGRWIAYADMSSANTLNPSYTLVNLAKVPGS